MSALRQQLIRSLAALGFKPSVQARLAEIEAQTAASERRIARKVERERARHAYAEAEVKRLRACRERFGA